MSHNFGKSQPILKLVARCFVVVTLGALFGLPGVSRADPLDRKTFVTLGETCRVGTTLIPPGRYVFRLFQSTSTRNIVQVFTEDERQILTSVITVPSYRSQPSETTDLVFGEAPSGQPLPLRFWFYPGQSLGQQFVETNGSELSSRLGQTSEGKTLLPRWQSRAVVHDKFALVVGISHFSDPRQDLRFAEKDALDVAAALTNPEIGRFPNDPIHLRVLCNEQASADHIRNEMNDIGRYSGPDDLVFLYFSSHGSTTGGIATFETGQWNPTAGISYAELLQIVMVRFHTSRVVVVVDACFPQDNGMRPDGAKSLRLPLHVAPLRLIPQPTGVALLLSSRSWEESFESQQLTNSFFTHFFLEALRFNSGLLTIEQLHDYIAAKVPSAVWMQKHQNQHPELTGDWSARGLQIGVPIR